MSTVNKQICGKTKEEWLQEYPIIKDICTYKEAVWCNPFKEPFEKAILSCPLTKADIKAADARLKRFAPYFKVAFPETAALDGILESPVQEIQNMKSVLENKEHVSIPGNLWIKLDSHLPISGSIKARGGIYEVLKIAEDIALEHNLIREGSDYTLFNTENFRKIFSQYAIAVGSTGNLGLSIGIMSAKLGFRVTVHMSADARQWKKDMLRKAGVEVLEYKSDYGIAVAEGRKAAQSDPSCHFIDDENSQTLFLGYTVAGLRLKKQLEEKKIEVDNKHPLFVYLPCGVGGGPGGVAFGLKMIFGDAVHCFFAEPTHSCCMMLGMATGKNNAISVQDFGLDNCTAADGLAVGRASGFVGSLMLPFISGCYSLDDSRMFHMLTALADAENIYLEPSALAGMYGPVLLEKSFDFRNYIKKENLDSSMMHSTQLIWATGGSMVPKNEMLSYYKQGQIS
ncbi:D-serine ammonia-lyase [Treponema sp. HNW]|uniref:D-serine ammonia-lyase n=1 Tax=Treponema sp. HNW TaxID=3116654 RepID=UPI003D0E73F6